MLLFFDIDGTLFDDCRRLPASVLPALRQASQNGHRLFINTGRTLCNKDERLRDFPFDGWVMGCGTRIIYHEKTVRALEYDLLQSLGLRTLFREINLPAVFECDTGMYFDPEGPQHPAVPLFRDFAEKHGICRDIREDDPEFRAVKMFCFSDRPERIEEMKKRTAAFGIPFTAVDRGHEGWEVIPAGYSKATGMDEVCRMLHADIRDTVAFGDSSNDETMLRHAGISVAMGNAPDGVKALCTCVTDRPEEDGIQKAMKALRII